MLRKLRSVSRRSAEDEQWASELAAWINQMREMEGRTTRPRPHRPRPYPNTARAGR